MCPPRAGLRGHDSKTPMNDYLDAIEAEGDISRASASPATRSSYAADDFRSALD